LRGLWPKTGLSGEQRNYLQLIQDSAQKPATDSPTIFFIRKIEAGKIELKKSRQRVRTGADTISRSYKAEEKGIILSTRTGCRRPARGGRSLPPGAGAEQFRGQRAQVYRGGTVRVRSEVKLIKKLVGPEVSIEDSALAFPTIR